MQPQTLELYDQWAAAYAMATGVPLVKVTRASWSSYVFDDSRGQASRALGEWRANKAFISARAYAEAVRQVRQLAHR